MTSKARKGCMGQDQISRHFVVRFVQRNAYGLCASARSPSASWCSLYRVMQIAISFRVLNHVTPLALRTAADEFVPGDHHHHHHHDDHHHDRSRLFLYEEIACSSRAAVDYNAGMHVLCCFPLHMKPLFLQIRGIPGSAHPRIRTIRVLMFFPKEIPLWTGI